MHCRALHSGGALIKGNSGWDNDVANDDDKDVEDDDDNRGLIKAGAEWWVRLWWQLLSQEQISSLLPPLITEAALIINNCIALITETWNDNGTIQLPLITYYTSSFLVPNLDPVLCFACYTCPPPLITPIGETFCWSQLNMFKWSQLFAFDWVSPPELVFGPFYKALTRLLSLEFLPCTQSRTRSLLVTPVPPPLIGPIVETFCWSTCSNGRSFLLLIGFHPWN